MALQPDGKIIAVGGGADGFAVARYNPNGSLDPSFSGDGKQTTGFCTPNCGGASGVALQPDGKIVVVGGGAGFGANVDFAIARYNPDGSLDPSFSGDGKQTTDFGIGSNDFASAVALQANGRIVAVGTGPRGDFALARYNPNGSLDPSFSGDGKQTTDFGPTISGSDGVAIQANGKIVAVGGGERRLRARPLRPQRLARSELLRRRQADDRLRRQRRGWGERGGDPD